MTDEEIKQACIDVEKHRRENFAVRIEASRFRFRRGNFDLSVTHNGTLWTSVSVTRGELRKISRAINKTLKQKQK